MLTHSLVCNVVMPPALRGYVTSIQSAAALSFRHATNKLHHICVPALEALCCHLHEQAQVGMGGGCWVVVRPHKLSPLEHNHPALLERLQGGSSTAERSRALQYVLSGSRTDRPGRALRLKQGLRPQSGRKELPRSSPGCAAITGMAKLHSDQL
jgi:hypothetical protein